LKAGADWTAWLPGTCQVGRLVSRGRWAATSNVEAGQTTYPVYRVRQNDGQSHIEEDRERGSGTGWGSYLDICATSSGVPSYATADGAVCCLL